MPTETQKKNVSKHKSDFSEREYDRLQAKIARLEQKKKDIQQTGKAFRLSFIQDSDEKIQLYTGFHNYTAFMAFYDFTEPGPEGANLRHYSSKDTDRLSDLSLQNELLMTLMKLRLGLSHQDLALRFCVDTDTVEYVFEAWLDLLHERFQKVSLWKPQSSDLPPAFRHLPNTRVILTEMNLKLVTINSWNFSELNAITSPRHAIIGFSPSGHVTVITSVYFEFSSVLPMLENLSFTAGDTFINTTDHHITKLSIANECSTAAIDTKESFSSTLSCIIGGLDQFKILRRCIPHEDVDSVVAVCCGLLNCQKTDQR